jgi:hypothetical protein
MEGHKVAYPSRYPIVLALLSCCIVWGSSFFYSWCNSNTQFRETDHYLLYIAEFKMVARSQLLTVFFLLSGMILRLWRLCTLIYSGWPQRSSWMIQWLTSTSSMMAIQLWPGCMIQCPYYAAFSIVIGFADFWPHLCIRYIQRPEALTLEDKKRFHFFNSFFYKKLSEVIRGKVNPSVLSMKCSILCRTGCILDLFC